jgi:hypothetical protein
MLASLFPNLTLPNYTPTSAPEAVSMAQAVLHSAGLSTASVSLLQPPVDGEPFLGARVLLSIPEAALEECLLKVAQTKAAEQGAKVKSLRLQLASQPPRPDAASAEPPMLSWKITASASLMMATVEVTVSGEFHAASPTVLTARQLALDAGTGMFAGMASALLRPQLLKAEGRSFPLPRLAGQPVQLDSVRLTPDSGSSGERPLLQIEVSCQTP